jgi:hypothetical protein
MVLIKGITTYRREVLRGSHSQLREIVIRYVIGGDPISMHIKSNSPSCSSGSLQYYLIIIALDVAVLCIFKYGGVSPNLEYTAYTHPI